MPHAPQEIPPAIRARLEAVKAKLPPGWTVIEMVHESFGWTARVADENGVVGTEILIFDQPPENPHHKPPGENDRI